MVDDPFADIGVNAANDPFADIGAQIKPKKGLEALGVPQLARDVIRGVISPPVDLARLLGAVGADTIGEYGNRGNEWLNENVSQDARFDQEPMRAALQFGSSALVPIRGVGPATAVAKMAPGVGKAILSGATRLVELALPGSSPFTKANVALNAGVGIGIGAGVEELTDQAYPQQQPVPRPDRAVAPDIDASPRITVPGAQTVVEDDPYAAIADAVPEGNPYAKAVVNALPWVLLAGGLGAVGAAARSGARKGAAADAANVDGLTQPGTPNTIQSSNTFGEGVEAGIFNNLETLAYRMKDAAKAGNVSMADADATIQSSFINLREAVNNDRTSEFLNHGILDGTHRVQTSPRALFNEVGTWDQATQTKFYDLMAAADELDVRKENIKRGKLDKSGEPERVALADISYKDLEAREALGRSDPRIAAIEQGYRDIMNLALDYAVSNRTFSAQEVANMRAMGPNYMHRVITDMTIQRNKGAGMPLSSGIESNSPLSARTRGEEAGPLRMQNPAFAMEAAIRQTFDYIHRNNTIREIAEATASNVYDATAGAYVPRGHSIRGVGRILPASAQTAPGYVGVKFKDNGSQLQIELDEGLAAPALPYPRTFVPILNGFRMLEQQGTTGLVGAMMGNVQAFVSTVTSAATAMVTAPSKMRVGYFDALFRKLTGGKVNIRQLGIVDPTFALQLVDESVRALAAHSADALAQTLTRSAMVNGYTAKMLGPAWTRRVIDTMTTAYETSQTAYLRREGVLSQGISYAADNRPTHTNIANMSPEFAQGIPYGGNAASIMDVRSKAQFDEWAAKTSNRLTPPKLRKAWHFVSRALDLLSNTPQMALYRLNKGHMNERELLGLSRTVAGDPAQYGGYKGVQALTSVMEYQNIAMQAAHQVFKSYQREPVQTAARMATLGAMLSLVQIHSAIFADEEAEAEGRPKGAVAHMLTRDASDAARSFRIYYGSENPEDSIRIPVDGALSPFFSAVLAGMVEAFDVTNPAFFTEQYAPLRNSIETLVSDGTWDTLRAGIGAAGADLSTPSLIRLGGQVLADTDMRNALSFGTGNRMSKTQDAPGYVDTKLNRDPLNKYVSAVLETMIGLGGQVFAELARTFGYTAEAKGPTAALGAMGEHYSLVAANSGSARIWSGDQRSLRVNDRVGEQVRASEQKMQAISKDFSNVAGEGTIGNMSTARPSPYGAGKEGVPPDIVETLGAFKDLYNKLDDFRTMRKMQSDELRDAMSSPQLRSNPKLLRQTTNEHVTNIRSINASIYHHIDAMEKQEQARTGRAVRLQDLDPLKGLDQFAPLQ